MLRTLRDWQKPARIYDVIQESIVSPSVNNTNCRHSDPTQEELTDLANPNLLSRHQIMPGIGWQTLLRMEHTILSLFTLISSTG